MKKKYHRQRAFCECGNVAIVKKDGILICQRCADLDRKIDSPTVPEQGRYGMTFYRVAL